MPKRAVGVLMVLLLGGLGACSQRVDAKFRLTEGSVMVLIDDADERIDWPAARRYIWDDVGQELLRTESAKRIVPLETEQTLRQTLPDFNGRSCREIGELAGAAQVIWIEIQDFLAEEMIVDAGNAAYLAATVKVVNPTEKKERRKVRSWPESIEGQYLNVKMTGAAVVAAKSKDEICKELSAKLAVQVARLFHDHQLHGFEDRF